MSDLDKIFVLLIIALIFLVSIIGVVWYFSPEFEAQIPSEPIFVPEHGPIPEPFNFTLSSKEFEVAQGKSISINLYATSPVHETDATTNFSWYLRDYQNQSWPSTEPVPLEIVFDPNQAILKYKEPKTIVMTIKTADDAPLGEYRVNLELFASVNGSNFRGYRNIWITVIP